MFIGFGFITGFVLARAQFLLGHLLTTLLSFFLFSGLVLDGTVVALNVIWGAFLLSGSALTWIGEFRESPPSSAHPS